MIMMPSEEKVEAQIERQEQEEVHSRLFTLNGGELKKLWKRANQTARTDGVEEEKDPLWWHDLVFHVEEWSIENGYLDIVLYNDFAWFSIQMKLDADVVIGSMKKVL